MNQTFAFDKSENDIKSMAILTAQFIKEGVIFTVRQNDFGFEISLTGGF